MPQSYNICTYSKKKKNNKKAEATASYEWFIRVKNIANRGLRAKKA